MYNHEDLLDLLDFARKTDGTLEDWYDKRSLSWTDHDDELYSNITYHTYSLKSGDATALFYLIRGHSHDTITHFTTKFCGSKEYYDFILGDGDGYLYRLVCFDDIYQNMYGEWVDHGDFKGVKELKSEGILLIFDGATELNDGWERHIDRLRRESPLWFWNMGSNLCVMIDNNVEFKNVKELINKI